MSRRKTFALVELVAPDDDGLEGERALAQARDHGLAAGLDALGDGDLALAGKKLHRAHFAQIHTDGVVGALGGLFGRGFGRHPVLLDLDQLAALALGLLLGRFARDLIFGLGFLGLDHVDTHLAELRQDVLDLLGLDLLRGQQRNSGLVELLSHSAFTLTDPGEQISRRQEPLMLRRKRPTNMTSDGQSISR